MFDANTPTDLRHQAMDVARLNVQAVMIAAEAGGRHTPGSWTKEGTHHHIRHAIDHLDVVYAILFGPTTDLSEADDMWEEIEHAHCRLTMALWCKQHGLLGDNGEEGVDA